ncbi:hypothetical protein H4217_001947 [Coemansia sp. RSA 1939]|nr:hypothetical protein H4217_001947 [Coemansia sp. RSA 1939]KAJ2616375.1 hypothetical protein EV177_001105 [Coemansia sp. RSA 1804]
MPRRQRRRLEWTNSMQSDTTLMELAVEPAANSAAQERIAARSDEVAANTRPLQIRSAAPGLSSSGGAPTTQHSTSREPQSIVRQSAPVTRSDSEQTNADVANNADAKMQFGFGHRIKESIVRRFRLFSGAFISSHTANGSHGADGYYSVSLY